MLDANLRTPAEAREKWCPMYRLAVRDARLRNDVEDNRKGCCLADDCQDWMWDDKQPNKGYCGIAIEQK